jgi:hypothetical protein
MIECGAGRTKLKCQRPFNVTGCVFPSRDSSISSKGAATMYNEKFIEQVFEIHPNVELARVLFPFLENIEDYQFAHCIYLDDKKLITGAVFTSPPEKPSTGFRNDFRDYLDKTNPGTFTDLLVRVDLYDGVIRGHCALPDLVDLTYRQFPRIPMVNELLEMSSGLLLWHHQLESLFALFLTDHARIVDARRGINMKNPEAFRLAKSLKLDENLTLEDIILERMILGAVKFPNIHGANILYRRSGNVQTRH